MGGAEHPGGAAGPSPWLQGQINAAPIHGWLLEEPFVLLPFNFLTGLFPPFSAATRASRKYTANSAEKWAICMPKRCLLNSPSGPLKETNNGTHCFSYSGLEKLREDGEKEEDEGKCARGCICT